MSGFRHAFKSGQEGEKLIAEHYDAQFQARKDYKGFEPITDIATQKIYGDIKFDFGVKNYYVEVKTDGGAGETGNIVVEFESNKGITKGWLHGYEKVDYLVYYYKKAGWGIVVPWRELRRFVVENKSRWKVVGQNKYQQKNIPQNYLVPYEALLNEVIGAKKVTFKEIV